MIESPVQKAPGNVQAKRIAESLEVPWFKLRQFWIVSVSLFVIASAVFLAGWFQWHQAEADRRDDLTSRQLLIDSENQITNLLRWYETAIQTVKLSALHPAVRNFRENPEATRTYFKELSGVVRRFSQLRILMPEGMEVIRVDRRDTHVVVVPEDQYQNKAGRYYFEASRLLHPGQVYISRLDLNVEHGKIEFPYQPTSRLITPITTAQNEVIGYLAINLDMAEPLSDFLTMQDGAIARELLNREGYWLAGVSDDQLWGFMLGENTTLAARDAQLWEKMSAVVRRATFAHHDLLYHVGVLSIADLAEASEQELVLPDQPKLYVVSKASKYDGFLSTRPADRFIFVGAILAITCFSILIGYFAARRKQAQDIQQRIEENLVSVRRMAALGRIVAGVAHEMRTPLGNALSVSTTVVHDMDEMIVNLARDAEYSLQSEDIEHLRRGISIIQKNIERTSVLVRNFKETATDQSNHVRRNFDMAEVAHNLVGTLASQLAKKGIELTLSAPETAPIDSYADAIDQIMLSLINNAVQHAFYGRESGKIELDISDFDEKFYRLVVWDDGIGIDPKDHERVFEPFWSSDLPDRGSGLGLTIVSNIVVGVLGGEITLQSEPGEGSSFIMMIPKVVPVTETANPYIFEDGRKNGRGPAEASRSSHATG